MKTYFNFSRKERIGVVVLSCVILGLTVILNVGYNVYIPDPLDVDKSQLEFLSVEDTDTRNENKSDKPYAHPEEIVITDFDPNKIDKAKWVSFGFSEKQANSILNYKNNYGPFRHKEDIKKLYVVSDEMYARLEPHIRIETKLKQEEAFEEITSDELLVLELNTATVEDLVKLNGIGPVYAERIVKYRSKLGGFVDPSQIENIYISDEAKSLLQNQTTIDPALIKTTNLNKATKQELEAIPYSNWEVVARIIKEREKAELTNLNFLPESVISEEDREKFAKYVNF